MKRTTVIFVVVFLSLIAVGGAYAYWMKRKLDSLQNMPIGGQRDSHGCVTSAGYSWCAPKQRCLRSGEEKCEMVAPVDDGSSTTSQKEPPLIGGQKDDHGCLLGAGYSWCEAKKKCLRPWEENCTASSTLHAYLRYQPKQCEETPWQLWYKQGNIKFIKAPTDEELIKAYYGSKSVNVISVIKEDTDRVTCEACTVCQTSYYFSAVVASGDAVKMKKLGWVE